MLKPTSCWATRDALTKEFLAAREKTATYVKTTPDDLHGHGGPHPVFKMLDGYQWVLLLSAHGCRADRTTGELSWLTSRDRMVTMPMATLKNLSVVRRIGVVSFVALVVLPSVVAAQPSPVYVGGTVNLVTQTHSATEPLGGTARGGSVVFGVQVSRRVAVEFEPSFGEPYSWEYTYSHGPSRTAHVVASRRDSFYSFQLRMRGGVFEPVVGVSYVHSRISRHATTGSTTYFDESRSDHGLAAVGGLDAAVKVTSHLYFVPTFRLLARLGWTADSSANPLGAQTSTGPFIFRYGAGVRVTF